MTDIRAFDSSYSPNEAAEAANRPDCGACYDSGIIVDEDVFCDCASGCAAQDNHDFDNDCYEGGLFEDDGDALASAGMGTDEDYGGW